MDLSELPLKPPCETFTDEPQEINDVNIHDLVIDIEDNTKDINKLHHLQAVAIFLHTLEDIIKLQTKQELFKQFRHQQLTKRNIDPSVYELSLPDTGSSTSDISIPDNNHNNGSDPNIANIEKDDVRKTTPPNSPPSKILKVEMNLIDQFKETTPDSLIVEDEIITIEELIASTDINKSCEMNFDDITQDFNYYQDPKIRRQNHHVIKVFNLVELPNLTIEDFLIRIKTYSPSVSVSCYIHASLMIFKLSILLDVLPLTYHNVHRIILASIRCSTKKLEDIYQKQNTFATVGGVTVKELFKIEVGFLFLCNFKLIVGNNSLNNYLKDFTALRCFVKENIDDVND